MPDRQQPSRLQETPPSARIPAQVATSPNEFPLVNMENATALRTTGVLQIPPHAPPKMATGTTANPTRPQPHTDAAATELPALPPKSAADPSTKKPKKPVKIDPAVLERVLKARNGGN
jgi:hypothetical protein